VDSEALFQNHCAQNIMDEKDRVKKHYFEVAESYGYLCEVDWGQPTLTPIIHPNYSIACEFN